VDQLLRQARAAAIPLDGPLLARRLANAIERALTAAAHIAAPDAIAACDELSRAAKLARTLATDVNLWRAQSAYLLLIQQWRRTRAAGDAPVDALTKSLERLGNALDIRIGDLDE
jgi:hypothetical protein